MRRKDFLSIPALALTILASLTTVLASQPPKPFLPARTATPVRRYHAATPVEALFARQTTSGCISGTFSCATDQGAAFSGICCASGQVCTLDVSSSAACCPSGDVCTGTAPSSYRAPSTTSASYVNNQFFSFPYIATSFSNAGACSKAVSQCSVNYAACTAGLEGAGGSGGVTVVVGGSTTVGGSAAATYATSSATSICSSLSRVACSGIQDSYCTAGSTAGFSVGSANAAARPTGIPCVGIVAGVAAGVGFGMVGI